MGFFIRKAFKAGPLQINLSKGEDEISGGITGAQIGLNRNGAYVYGGRHGLYYREPIGKKKKSRRTADHIKPNGRPVEINPNGPTDLFVDTGATFPSPYDLIEPHPWPELIEQIPRHKNPMIWIAVVVLAGISVAIPEPVVWAISVAGFLVISWTIFKDYRWRKKGHQMVESIAKVFEENPKTVDLSPMHRFEDKAPIRYNERFMPDLFTVIIQIAMEKMDDEHIFSYNKLEKQIPVSDEFIKKTKQAILTRRMETVLEDQLLTKEQESKIRKLIKKLDLSDQFIFEELQYLDLASSVRNEMESPLKEVDSPIPLDDGEQCFAVYDDVRLLEERVQERFKHNRIQYRKLEYEIQIEGTLVMTDQRFVIFGSESKEYPLNDILDVIIDLEANTIEITISGQKSPIYLTSKMPMIIAARLEKIIESETKSGHE